MCTFIYVKTVTMPKSLYNYVEVNVHVETFIITNQSVEMAFTEEHNKLYMYVVEHFLEDQIRRAQNAYIQKRIFIYITEELHRRIRHLKPRKWNC